MSDIPLRSRQVPFRLSPEAARVWSPAEIRPGGPDMTAGPRNMLQKSCLSEVVEVVPPDPETYPFRIEQNSRDCGLQA